MGIKVSVKCISGSELDNEDLARVDTGALDF